MSIPIHCHACGKSYAAPDHLAGKHVACPHCQTALQVPATAVPGMLASGPVPAQPGWAAPANIPLPTGPLVGAQGPIPVLPLPGQSIPGQPVPGQPVAVLPVPGTAAVAPLVLGPLSGRTRRSRRRKMLIAGGAGAIGLLVLVLAVALIVGPKRPVVNIPPGPGPEQVVEGDPAAESPEPESARAPDGSVRSATSRPALETSTTRERDSDDDKPVAQPPRIWRFAPDPRPEAASFPCDQPMAIGIQYSSTPDLVFPSAPSPFVAIRNRSMNNDGPFSLWNLQAVKQQGKVEKGLPSSGLFRLSPDGRYLACFSEQAGADQSLNVWSFQLSERVATIPLEDDPQRGWFDFLGPEELVWVPLTATKAFEVFVWTIGKRTPKARFAISTGYAWRNRQFALSPGRKYIAVLDGTDLRIYELASGQLVADATTPAFAAGRPAFRSLAFSSDGRLLAALATIESKQRIVLWDVAKNGEVSASADIASLLPDDRHDSVPWREGLQWLAHGQCVLVGGTALVEPRSGQAIWTRGSRYDGDRVCRVLDDKHLLAVERGGGHRVLHAIDLPPEVAGEKLASLARQAEHAVRSTDPPVAGDRTAQRKAALPGRAVAWGAAPDPAGAPSRSWQAAPLALGKPRVWEAKFAAPPVGQAVLLRSQGSPRDAHRNEDRVPCWLERYDMAEGKSTGRLNLPNPFHLMDVSPSGARAVLRAEDRWLAVWSLSEEKRLCAWIPYRDAPAVTWAAFVGEEHVLTLSENPRQLVLWKVPEAQAVWWLNTADNAPAVLSPGRKYVVVLHRDKLRVLDALSGEAKGDLPAPSGLTFAPWQPCTAAFSADGGQLAIAWKANAGPELVVWDFAKGQVLYDAPNVLPWTGFSVDSGKLPMVGWGDGTIMSRMDKLFNIGGGNMIQWVGSRHLLYCGDAGLFLVDLPRRGVVWRCQYQNGMLLPASPDGRQWLLVRPHQAPAYLAGCALVGDALLAWVDANLPREAAAPVFGPGAAVTVETSRVQAAGLKVSASRIDAALQKLLAARGTRVAAGQPLRLFGECTEGERITEQFVEMKTHKVLTIQLPVVNMRVALVDSAGKMLFERTGSAAPQSFFGVLHASAWNVEGQLRDACTKWQKEQVESFFEHVALPRVIYPPIVDPAGQPGLAANEVDMVQLFSLAAGTLVEVARREEVPRPTSIVPAPEYRSSFEPGEDLLRLRNLNKDERADLEKAIRANIQRIAVETLADDAALQRRLRWFPAGKRPAIGIRWAIGVQTAEPLDRRARDPWYELSRLAGDAGTLLGQCLQERATMGQFGQLPRQGEENLCRVMLVAGGSEEQVLAAARRQAADMVAMIVYTTRVSTSGNRSEQVRIRLMNVLTERPLWSSESVNPSQRTRSRRGGTSVEEIVEAALKRVDEECRLRPMPNLDAEIVKNRAQSLVPADAKPDNPLLALVELRYYQAKKLLTAEEATPYYDAILGKGKGRTLATGEPDERRIAVLEWLKSAKQP